MGKRTDKAREFPMRDYQIAGKNKIVAAKRIILADERGVAKTRQALEAAMEWGGRTLIVVGLKVAAGVWQEQIKSWITDDPHAAMIYGGSISDRAHQRLRFKLINPRFVITNIAMLKEVIKLGYFKNVLFDEYHKMGLVNRKSKTGREVHAYINAYTRPPENVVLISGSPYSKSPADLWGPLHLLAPKKFSSYWRFVNTHCVIHEDWQGFKHLQPQPKDVKALATEINPFFIRRKLKKVLPEIKDPIRNFTPLDLTSEQRVNYDRLAEEFILELGDEVIVAPNKISSLVKLRQLLISPRLLGGPQADIGTMIPELVNAVEEELNNGKPVIIFTPFRAAVKLIHEQLTEYCNHLHEHNIYEILGGDNAAAVNTAQDFQDDMSDRKVLIGTIKSAVSYTATCSDVAYFCGPEWSHIEQDQAEGRIHRFSQLGVARFEYYRHKHTVEEAIFKNIQRHGYWSEITLSVGDIRASESIG